MKHRPVTLDDASAIHQLTRRWEKFWEAPLVTPLHEIEDELTAPYIELETQTCGYWDGDRMVAYGRVWHRPSGQSQERAYLQGRVDPEYRGRGIGRDLFKWQFDAATEQLIAIGGDLPKYLRADEWDEIEESHRMYRRFGLQPVRHFTEMVKPLGEPAKLKLPEGIEIIPYNRSLDAEALEVLNQSFADHWGSTPTDPASYQHRLEGDGSRLDASFIAVADGHVVGVTLNAHFPEDEELLGRRDGWIENLGVLKEWRTKGIATALLTASFNAFLERGFTHAALGVDTASPTDAFGLYGSLGFEPTQRSTTSELEISPV